MTDRNRCRARPPRSPPRDAGRRRPPAHRPAEAGAALELVRSDAGAPRIADRPLSRSAALVGAARCPLGDIDVEDCRVRPGVVVQLVEDGKRLLGLPAHRLEVDAGRREGTCRSTCASQPHGARPARRRPPLPPPSPRAATASACSVLPAWKSASARSGMSSRPRGSPGQERERALVEVHRRRPVAAHERRGGPPRRAARRRGRRGRRSPHPRCRARRGSGGPARGGRRGTPRPRRRGRRARARASRRSARAGRSAPAWGGSRRRRRG